jgi:hypothetical protein
MPGTIWPSSPCSTSASGTSTAAPITGPQNTPTPPNSDTMSACADTSMPNMVCGVTTSRTLAYRPPAVAAMAALTMMAYIFCRAASTPAASAAGSFCLIASSERPKRERSTRSDTIIAATSTAIASAM